MRDYGKRTDAGTTARSVFGRYGAELICALLLTLMAATQLAVIRQKSITIDELVMTPAGYYHLTAGDYRPVNEHPPFAKLLAALPLLFTGTEAPRLDPQPGQDYAYFVGLFLDFWRANEARYETITFWSRVPAIAVTALLGALVFVYARRYWGDRAALFAVALFTLEPTVLAHGRVVQTDIPSALALLVFSFTLFDYLKAPGARRAVFVGLALGLAAVTKFSMVALGPVTAFVLLALLALAPRRGLRRAHVAGHALALALAAVFAVNAAYLFHRRPPEPLDEHLSELAIPAGLEDSLRGPVEAAYYAIQCVFPADFVSGVAWQLGHAREGHRAGLLGQYSTRGWWYYFPVAFALKTTLPFLLLSLASLGWALLGLRRRAEGRVLVLVVPLAAFTGLLMLSTINIGVRYYLPAYPFLCVLGGALLDSFLRRHRHHLLGASLAVAGVLCWAAVEAARAYPDHMTYMNQLARGAPRWWYLSDSNVEWGDDLRGLALYLRERGEKRVGAAVLNGPVLEHYGIEPVPVFARPGGATTEARYVAIGASFLNGSTMPGEYDGVRLTEEQRVNYYDEFRRRQPEKIFGNSIYLYRMED